LGESPELARHAFPGTKRRGGWNDFDGIVAGRYRLMTEENGEEMEKVDTSG
jgi:hypothetical protein